MNQPIVPISFRTMPRHSALIEADPMTRPAAKSPERSADIRRFAEEAARLLKDDKCEDVVLLDVRGVSPMTDFILIGTGTSDRQMRSAMNHLEELAAEQGVPPYRRGTDEDAIWLVCDFIDLVVHLFEPNARAHYDIESLWHDARPVAWEREG